MSDTSSQYSILALRDEENFKSYLYRAPETGNIVEGRELDNEYYHAPAQFPLNEAQSLLELTRKLRPHRRWVLEVAPLPCPSCGQEHWANDGDFCYPVGRASTRYTAGCRIHNFGCGFVAENEGYEATIRSWNTALIFNYPNETYVRVERLGKDGLAELLLEDKLSAKLSVSQVAGLLAKQSTHSLHFVALHYLSLVKRFGD